ncbi:hypothetical protein ACIBHX_46405 [Nonomuraea sp. NPDC050536]|uniref:hypothetical protein n=1 Tax=Nonomuraea sp. NPDC050536 TaxID=3364366 RepID=UPI0037C5A30B
MTVGMVVLDGPVRTGVRFDVTTRKSASEDVKQLGEGLMEISYRHERLISGLLLLAHVADPVLQKVVHQPLEEQTVPDGRGRVGRTVDRHVGLVCLRGELVGDVADHVLQFNRSLLGDLTVTGGRISSLQAQPQGLRRDLEAVARAEDLIAPDATDQA